MIHNVTTIPLPTAKNMGGNACIEDLVAAARNTAPVSGLTHGLYRYPARFSPAFVKAVIDTFSEPGDLVLDPFVGGGTTLVEALASGRHALGVDISSLAAFVCEAKTLVLNDRDIASLRSWTRRLDKIINMRSPGHYFPSYADDGYYRNITGRNYWRIRKAIEQALASVIRLRSENARTLGRCIVLKTAQWALDARKELPNIAKFRSKLIKQAGATLTAALDFGAKVRKHNIKRPTVSVCLNRAVAGIENEPMISQIAVPKLIITSPPYPGIHILYHRWQVDGRKEAPAPFWIANKLDGAGSSYYTMGDRKHPGLRTYFDNLRASFTSIAKICGRETTIVQMVAFSEPEWQLSRYLKVMEECGLKEIRPWNLSDTIDGRLWRRVPNRKWHADQKGRTNGSQEVVLVHRLRCKTSIRPLRLKPTMPHSPH